jgi:pyruvate-ferredoxin/flavodoxin oxidoreductase
VRRGAGGGLGWLRRLLDRRTDEPASESGTERVTPVQPMLGALEALVCEGVVHRPGDAVSAASARRLEPVGPPPRNAFGRPLQEEIGTGPEGSVSVATGMALAGLRATAFLGGDELAAAHQALRAAADRLTPLVIHVGNGDAGHAAYHGVADSGFFQLLASSGQEALDLSLVARWVAERALVPGLVATDGVAIERLRFPDEQTVRTYLGRPDERVLSPTEAQRLLFGPDRRRLVRWFDPEHPVATGTIRGTREEARARLGSRIFFRDHVAELAQQGMVELSRLTGRPLSFLQPHRLEDAELILVAQGSVVPAARAVAEQLRRSPGWKIGVLGVTWLRPLPVSELTQLLAGRKAVAVIEALDEPLAPEPPLFRELEAALGAGIGWVSATCAGTGPDPARLAGLCDLLRRRDRPHRVHLDRVTVPSATGFPRRDSLLQSVANSYPGFRESALPPAEPARPQPEGGKSVGLVGREAELPPDALSMLAETVSAEAGLYVHGTATRPEPGAWDARVRAAATDFPDPGPRAPVSLLVVASANPRDLGNPLEALAPRGTVIVTTTDGRERVWRDFPSAWRRTIEERELRVLLADGNLDDGLEAVRACLRGDEQTLLEERRLREVRWRELPVPDGTDRGLPRVVRRIERIRAAHDSLPRFWGEVAQPRQGGAADDVPDPLTASGVVPAGASALEPEPAAPMLPDVDAEACTGCGRCWTACPDAAIGVTVLGIDGLLTASSHVAGTQGKAADSVRRAHRNLAGRLAGQLSKAGAGTLTAEECQKGWDWLVERMKLSEDERPAHEEAFRATLDVASSLPLVVTRPFFHEPEDQARGAGELLTLAFDPRSCLGCHLCIAVCPEDALHPKERTVEQITRVEERWRIWEELPDTAGATLARAADHADVGALASVLLSRHCAQAQVGSAAGEPASGERLAGRLVASLVEHHSQRRTVALVKGLDGARETLEQKVRDRISESVSTADVETLAEALSRARGRSTLSELGQQLDALGAPATFDRRAVLRMTHLIGAVEELRHRLAEGEDGLGRARFGVVVARGTVAEWAARFPRHPYYAPLTLAPTRRGVELARGIARGLVIEHLELVRTMRHAALEAESPPDRSERLDALHGLVWEDLEAEDRAACPPLLLIGDDSALLEHGFDALTRLLSSELPVKVIVLDGRSRLAPSPEPALVGMSHRRAFVLASSLAYPDHLAHGLSDALAWPGPALIHIHAPSPARHGFPAEATLEQARRAVEARAHILFRYNPGSEGLFGLRATLEGNPGIDADWSGITFAEWAASESRFADHFEPLEEGGVPMADWLALAEGARKGKVPVVEVGDRRLAVGERMARAAGERLAVWNTLRELVGIAGPFTEGIRAALEKELAAAQETQLTTLKSDYEGRIEQIRAGKEQEAMSRLVARLMSLAGYTARPASKGNGE